MQFCVNSVRPIGFKRSALHPCERFSQPLKQHTHYLSLHAARACTDLRASQRETPLHLASYGGHTEVVKALIKAKAGLNAEGVSDFFLHASEGLPFACALAIKKG
jgi:hypothetical protein